MSSAARKIEPVTFRQIEAALDAGRLEMMRPQGDWVPVKRRCNTTHYGRHRRIEVFMESAVESCLSTHGELLGYPELRIV